jgi:hypothetical protein
MSGTRTWRKSVSFVKHLIETMRSLANHATDELKGGTTMSATRDDSLGRLGGVLVQSATVDPRHQAAAREQLALIEERFASDEEVVTVLRCLAIGLKGPEVQRKLGITQRQYETIVLRLRRGIDRDEGWKP